MNLRLGGGACPFLLIFFSIIGSAGIERVLREGYIMRVPKEHCNQKRQFTAYCFVGIVLSKRQRMLRKEILNNKARAKTHTNYLSNFLYFTFFFSINYNLSCFYLNFLIK